MPIRCGEPRDEIEVYTHRCPDKADETLRHRIVASAERYLAEAETSIDAWLGHEPMPLHRNDVAGLRAFILLKQASPEGYARIADETWQKWAPVIVGLPRCTVIDKSPEIAQILMDALNHAPAELLAAVRTIIRLERERIRAPGATAIVSDFRTIANGKMNSKAMAKVISSLLRVAAWFSVLVLALASWTPGEDMLRTGASGRLEHIVAYFISALLLVTGYPRGTPWVIGSALAVYAGVLEVGQIFVPGRHSQVEDFAASCLGVSLIVLPTMWIRRTSLANTE